MEGDESGRLSRDEIAHVLQAEADHMLKRAVDGLERLPLSDVAAVGATEYFSALPLALRYLQEQLPKEAADTVYASDLNRVSAYPAEACEFLRTQRDFIRFGRLGSRLRATYRHIENRYWRWRLRQTRRPAPEASVEPTSPNEGPAPPPSEG
jgi:hypothetical protein